MFEAYAIGVTLRLNNLISPQLALLAKEFEKLDGLTVALKQTLASISVDSGGFRKLAVAANSTNRAFEKATVSAAAFHRQLSAIQSMPGAPRLPGGGGGGGGGGGRRPPGPHGGNIHIGPGGVGLGSMGMATGDWFWPLAASAGAVYAGNALFQSAKELDTERQRFRLFGMSEAQNREAFKFVSGMHVYGSTQAGNMGAFREAQGVFRESGLNDASALAGAKLAAPVLAKLDFLSSSLDDDSQAKMHTANMNMLRYVESSGGLQSASEFNRIANFGYKLNASSGGTVDWSQLRQLKARAGAAGFNLTDDALARLEPVIGELKGGAVGFGLSTSFNRLTGATRVPNQIAHELVEQGIWDRSKVAFNANGGIKNFVGPGGPLSKDKIELLSSNPVLFYQQYIKPMYDKMKLDAAEIARQNVMIFGTTGGRNMSLVDRQMATILRSVDALTKTKGIDAAMAVGKDSLTGQQKEFEAAWTDFKAQFGEKMLPFFTGILKGGAAILRALPGASGTTFNTIASLVPGISAVKAGWDLLSSNGSLHGNVVRQGRYGPAPVTVHTQINLDGRQVAAVVSKHQGNAAGAPQTGIGTPDYSQILMPAGGIGF